MPKIIENSSHIQSILAICTKFLLHILHPLLQFHCNSQKGGGGGSVSRFTTVAQGRGEGAACKEDLVVVTLIDKETIQY